MAGGLNTSSTGLLLLENMSPLVFWCQSKCFNLIHSIDDSEHPLTLEELNVMEECLWDLFLQVFRSLPAKFRVNIHITSGTHAKFTVNIHVTSGTHASENRSSVC
uniref:Uncharacterized protein n=1 Tax=Salvator merianae TaxID=96440 RepID=A0A8D0CFB1_SALMN